MKDETRQKRRWTLRLALRSVGTVALVIVVFMAFIGAYAVNFKSSAQAFFIYWTIFFILLIGVVGIAVLDAMITLAQFRKEHKKLRQAFRRAARGDEEIGL